ncbi:20323_t:CDS:2 [Gigaspora rosea]|nr:20323_t:CDS:2 [Gigaspora rosea]
MRPKVNEAYSNRYIELLKNCWHQDPWIRPTADDLCETFKSWRDDEQIISKLDKFKPNINSEYIKKHDTSPKYYIQFTKLNHSIPHKTENLIIYESILNSGQTENLVVCMQENNEKINIVHKNDEFKVDNSSTINTDEININETLCKYSKNDKNNSINNSTNEIDTV